MLIFAAFWQMTWLDAQLFPTLNPLSIFLIEVKGGSKYAWRRSQGIQGLWGLFDLVDTFDVRFVKCVCATSEAVLFSCIEIRCHSRMNLS